MQVDEKRHDTNQRGATLVEYAVVAPILFLLLFGIVEFARLTASFTSVWTAAREGARYATTLGDSPSSPGTPRYLDCDGIRDAAQGLAIFARPTDAQITIVYHDAAGTPIADCQADATLPAPTAATVVSGSRVEVTAAGTFDAMLPFVGSFVDGMSLDSTQRRSVFEGVLGA